MTLHAFVEKVASNAILGAFPDAHEFVPAAVTQSTQETFGHYQCNTALRLGKVMKQNPRAVAEKIVAELQDERLAKVEIAGPGFINITLSPKYLTEQLRSVATDTHLGVPTPSHPERVIVEYSSPNVAKELHVGHLRSTIIGESIARIMAFLGHNVISLNHVGDWGTQFGMLITYMTDNNLQAEGASLSELMEWYRAAKKRFDEDEDFKKRSQQRVVALQGGEREAVDLWKKICQTSREGFDEIYRMLDVTIEERGESYYNPMLAPIVDELLQKKIAEISDGAACIFMDGFTGKDDKPLPMIIRKSNGGFNYDTTDLAAVKHRLLEEKADRIIYVTDAGQRLHFDMVFSAAKKIGWLKDQRLDHVTFGVVLGPDGKKFKTRSGETEKLIDLLQGAVDRADTILKERLPDISDDERKEMAEIMGIDAVKYADLSCHRTKDYVFSYDRMLKFEGNTAVFLLYAYVRVLGIKRKSQSKADVATLSVEHPSEIALAVHLLQFAETLLAVGDDLLPHRLCEYLYQLAEKFNVFFRDCQVVGSAEEQSRLAIAEHTAHVLEKGLNLLGMKVLRKM